MSAASETTRMAGAVGFTLAAQACRVGLTMLLTVLVTQVLGAEAFGLLTLGLTLATVATVVASFGVEQGVIYFVARARPAGGDAGPGAIPGPTYGATGPAPLAAPARERSPAPPSAAAAIRTAVVLTAGGGIVAGLLFAASAAVVANRVFEAPALQGMLLALAPMIPAATIFAAAVGALQGSFRVVERAIIEWIGFPLLTLVFSATALWAGYDIEGIARAYVASWIISAAVATSIALRIPGEKRPLILRPMLSFSLPLMLSILTGYLLFHVDTLMLGRLGGVREVGLYGVATRLSLPLFLVLASVIRAFSHVVARLYAHERADELESAYATTTEWILAINVAAGTLIAVYATPILSLFGEEFVAATSALRLLCLGLVVATGCGAAGYVLAMTRWQRLEMIDNLSLLALNVTLNYVFIPRFGMAGAALATATSAILVYALKIAQVWYLLSMQPFRARQLATPLAALAAAGVSRLSLLPFGLQGHEALAVGVSVYLAVYSILWWRWGCSDTSREALKALLRRRDPGTAP